MALLNLAFVLPIGESQERGLFEGPIAGAVTQVVPHTSGFRFVHDLFAGVEDATGIERLLDGLENAVDFVSIHVPYVRRAYQAVPMFARRCPAYLKHVVHNLIHDPLHNSKITALLEV